MILTIAEYWLILGLILAIIEIIIFPGFGIVFGGLGGLVTGVLLIYFPNFYSYQYLIFVVTSSITALVFYRFIKLLPKATKIRFNDIQGHRVQVVSDILDSKNIGQVLYSGTIMNARMLKEHEVAKADDIVFICTVQGNILLCSKDKKLWLSSQNNNAVNNP